MRIPLIALCTLLGWQLFAQNRTESQSTGVSPVAISYLQVAKDQSVIYTGKEQLRYPGYIIEHPYLVKEAYAEGTLVYDGISYPNVNMRLDLYRDELILLSPNRIFNVVLQYDKLDYADVLGYRIVYHRPDGLKGSPPAGYCQLLYDGQCKVFEKQFRSLIETRKEEVVTGTFNKSTRFYILKDQVYYPVKSKGSVLKLFPSHRKELDQHIKQQKLNFRRSPEQAIVYVVMQYESLNNRP